MIIATFLEQEINMLILKKGFAFSSPFPSSHNYPKRPHQSVTLGDGEPSVMPGDMHIRSAPCVSLWPGLLRSG